MKSRSNKPLHADMGKTVVIMVLFIGLFAPVADAQKLVSFQNEDRKYGFNDANGKAVITPQYDYVGDIGENKAAICSGCRIDQFTLDFHEDGPGRWGIVDMSGKGVIVSPKYGRIEHFVQGRAWVKHGDVWGLIDLTGKEIIPPRYDKARDFVQGRAWVQSGYEWGLTDLLGKKIIAPRYDEAHDFMHGLAWVRSGEAWGMIDLWGKEIIAPRYDKGFFSNETLAVGHVRLANKWGLVDRSGNETVPPKYDYLEPFAEGFAAAELNGKFGFIDTAGREAVPFNYDRADYFYQGWALVGVRNTSRKTPPDRDPLQDTPDNASAGLYRYGYIDKTLKEVIPARYDSATAFNDGFASVGLTDGNGEIQWGLIDTNGAEVLPLGYAYPLWVTDLEIDLGIKGMLNVHADHKVAIYHKATGKLSAFYTHIDWNQWEGVGRGKVNVDGSFDGTYLGGGKWGVIDTMGHEIVPPIYDWIDDHTSDYPRVNMGGEYNSESGIEGGKWGLLYKNGQKVLPCEYDDIVPLMGDTKTSAYKGDTEYSITLKGEKATIREVKK